MNPNLILRRIRALSDQKLAEALWYLQSLTAAELESFCQRLQASEARLPKSLRVRSGRWDYRADFDSLRAAIETICTTEEPFSSGLASAIVDFIADEKRSVAEKFHVTNIGREVWATLDWCLEERRPCFIEGREGRGKSASGRAWFEAHRGVARYVSLPGLGQQSDFFKAIADAYGVNYSAAKAPNQIRWRVRDATVQSNLVLVIDEAHHALPERHRAGRPPLIDWIDCDLCNAGVAVALISTPQFGPRLAEFEDRTQWNAGQFRRRFSGRWTALPGKTDESDLAALAQKAMPHVGIKGVKLAVGYAGTFDRDVSGLFDLVRDAQRRARRSGREHVTYQDLRDAYQLDRVPSENALAEAFKRQRSSRPEGEPAETLPDVGSEAAAQVAAVVPPDFNRIASRRGSSAPVLAPLEM